MNSKAAQTGQIEICEVGPRDGLQSLGVKLSVAERVAFIEQLYQAGLHKIEVGALVHPKYVPEMADSDLVFAEIKSKYGQKLENFSLLLPNQFALDKALALSCKSMAFFTATSNSFNQKNINKSTDESISVIDKLLQQVRGEKVLKRLYISTVFHCPYEGVMQVRGAMAAFEPLFAAVDEISIGDTTGMAEVEQVEELANWFLQSEYKDKVWWHFHDTYKKALANCQTTLQLGFKKYDSSAGGIGGCPFAPGAKGNVSTESLLLLAKDLGFQSKVDVNQVRKIASPIAAMKS